MQSGEASDAILIGIGANLPTPEYGPAAAACAAAVTALSEAGLKVARQSPWYESAPVPASDQPWYVNGVIQVQTAQSPDAVMGLLLDTEQRFGRVRGIRNAPRVLDLDLIAYGGLVQNKESGLILPHPRLHLRAFVLLPLADILPQWRHPATDRTVAEMTAALPDAQEIRKQVDNEGD